jgi:hypothetical protein
MCGGGPDLPPEKDPKVERQKAATDATIAANAKTAAARQSRRSQSLLASGAQGATGAVMTSSVLAQGKDKLGG